MVGADVARGALDPEGATQGFDEGLRAMKTRTMLPGRTNYRTPMDPRKTFGANASKWDAYNRAKGNMSLPRLAVNPAVEAWKSYNLGKPGAFLSTAFQAPARAGAAVTKPLWDRAEKAYAQPIAKPEVQAARTTLEKNPSRNYRAGQKLVKQK